MDINKIFDNAIVNASKPDIDFKEEADNVLSSKPLKSNSLATLGYDFAMSGEAGDLGTSKDNQKYRKYGITPNNWENLDKQLAYQQSNWVKAGNALAQAVISEVGLGTVGAFSDIFDFLTSKILHLTEDDYSNPLSDKIKEWQDIFRDEIAPVYTDPDINIQNGGLTDFGWYMKNIPNVASTLMLLLPAKTISGLAGMAIKGSKLAKGIGNARRWATGINKIEDAKQMSKFQAAINSFQGVNRANAAVQITGEALLMRTAENYQESRDTYQQLYREASDRFANMSQEEYDNWIGKASAIFEKEKVDPNNKDEVAKMIARRAADRTFAMDWTNVIFDIFQLYGLKNIGKGAKELNQTRAIRGLQEESKQAARNLRLEGSTTPIPNPDVATSLSFIDKASNVAKRGVQSLYDGIKYNGKVIAAEASEGVEEGVNYIAQQEGITYGKLLLNGQTDGYDKSNIFTATHATWANLNGSLKDYLATAELQESAFWGLIGGVAFHHIGSATNRVQRAIERNATNKKLRENPITGEQIPKESLANLFEDDDIRTARAVMNKRLDAWGILVNRLNTIKNGKDPFNVNADTNEAEDFTGDTEARANIAAARAISEFRSELAVDAINSGTYDMLLDYFRSDEVKSAMVELGLAEENEVDAYAEETIRDLESAKAEYARQSAHVLNQVAFINNKAKNKKNYKGENINDAVDIDESYARIIAKENYNKARQIKAIEDEMQALGILITDQEAITNQLGVNLNLNEIKEYANVGALISAYEQLSKQEAEIETSKPANNIQALARHSNLRGIREKKKAILKQISNATLFNTKDFDVANVYNAIVSGRNAASKINVDVELTDEAIIKDVRAFFGDKYKDVSDETIRQTGKATAKYFNALINKNDSESILNVNSKLFDLYVHSSYFNLQKVLYEAEIAGTTEQIRERVNYYQNFMNEVRETKIDFAVNVIAKAIEEYDGVKTDNDENLIEAINNAYINDISEAKRIADEIMANPGEDAVTASEFIDALNILALHHNSNQWVYDWIRQTLVAREKHRQQQRSRQVEENNTNSEGNSAANPTQPTNPSAQSQNAPQQAQGGQNQPATPQQPAQPSQPSQPQNTNNDNRRTTSVKIVINNKGNVASIEPNSGSRNNSYPAKVNPDGTYELDTERMSQTQINILIGAGLFNVDSDVDFLAPGKTWEITQNPVIRKKSKNKYEFSTRGKIEKLAQPQPAQPAPIQSSVDNSIQPKYNTGDRVQILMTVKDKPIGTITNVRIGPDNNYPDKTRVYYTLNLEDGRTLEVTESRVMNKVTTPTQPASTNQITPKFKIGDKVEARVELNHIVYGKVTDVNITNNKVIYKIKSSDGNNYNVDESQLKIENKTNTPQAAQTTTPVENNSKPLVNPHNFDINDIIEDTNGQCYVIIGRQIHNNKQVVVCHTINRDGTNEGSEELVENDLTNYKLVDNSITTAQGQPQAANPSTGVLDDVEHLNGETEDLEDNLNIYINELIPNIKADNIDFDNVRSKMIASVKKAYPKLSDEDIAKEVDAKVNEFKAANEYLKSIMNTNSIATSAIEAMFACRVEDVDSENFSSPFEKAITTFIDEYNKILICKQVDGKQLVRLEDLMRLCNRAYPTSQSEASAFYTIVKNYLFKNSDKYFVTDLDTAPDTIFSNINKTSNEIAKQNANVDEFRINIRDIIETNPSEKFFDEINKLKVGDTIQMVVQDEKLTFISNGVTIGYATKPRYVGSRYVQANQGWLTDIEVDANGNPISDTMEIFKRIFLEDGKDFEELRTLLTRLSVTGDNIEDSDVEDFVSNSYINSLIHRGRENKRNGKSNTIFAFNQSKNKSSGKFDFDEKAALLHLVRLWKYTTNATSATNTEDIKNEIETNLYTWFGKLYKQYKGIYNITINQDVIITTKKGGRAIRVLENSTYDNYEQLPLANDVIADKENAKITYVSSNNERNFIISGRPAITKAGFTAGSTFISLFGINNEPDFVKAYGVRLTDAEAINNSAIKPLVRTARQLLKDTIDEMIKDGQHSNTVKLESVLRSILSADGDTSQISLFRAKKGRFTIEPIQVKRKDGSPSTATGLKIVYYHGKDIQRFFFYNKTDRSQPFATSQIDPNGSVGQTLYYSDKNANYISDIGAKAFFDFLMTKCNINIDAKAVASDNLTDYKPNKGGFFYRENNKFVVHIPSTKGDYHAEFDSYNDFLIQGNLIRVNTKKSKNGTNFERFGENQKLNQTISVSLPITDTTQSNTNIRNSQLPDRIKLDNNTKEEDYISLVNTFQGRSISGMELIESILNDEDKRRFNDVLLNEQLFISDLFPDDINYREDMNHHSRDDIKQQPIAETAKKAGDKFKIYDRHDTHEPKATRDNQVIVGSRFVNMAASSRKSERYKAIKILMHEKMHIILGKPSHKNQQLFNAIDEVYQEFTRLAKEDLANNTLGEQETRILQRLLEVYRKATTPGNTRHLEEFLVDSLTNSVVYNYLNSKYVEGVEDNKKEDNLLTKIFKALAKFFGWSEAKANTLLMKQLNIIRDIYGNQDEYLGDYIGAAPQTDVVESNDNADITDDIEEITDDSIEEPISNDDSYLSDETVETEEISDEDVEFYDSNDLSDFNFAIVEDISEDIISIPVHNIDAFKNTLPLSLQAEFATSVQQGTFEITCR